MAETVRAEMTRLGRHPLAKEYEAAVPLGSTDMGNVTQLLPGIHPMVGVDAGGASLHQADFTTAAASPSADKAVLDGAIMLARTIVGLAESTAERDRVLAALEKRAAS
jgi:metal-dependent amidase/aminoacylase/carboxypeptidase family protein